MKSVNTKLIVISVQDSGPFIEPLNGIKEKMDITNGTVIGGDNEYYGVKLVNGEKEVVFETEHSISAILGSNGAIAVYEVGDDEPSIINYDGILVKDATSSYQEYSYSNEIRRKSSIDLTIFLERNVNKSYIEYKGERFPLTGSLVIGMGLFGFTIVVNIPGKESITTYPTHGNVYGVELNGGYVRVFEEDKSIPWTFTECGIFIKEAEYNKILRNEQAAYCRRHNITQEELELELSREFDTLDKKELKR